MSRRKKEKKKNITQSGCLGILSGEWWNVLLLILANLVVISAPIILGPTLMVSTTGFIVKNPRVFNQEFSLSAMSGNTVTSPAVVTNTVWLLLQLSGDVETNPGPVEVNIQDSYESSLVEGLAKLCRGAPSEKVRSVIGVWNPNKPGNEIRSTWQQGKRFLAPDLKGTLAWLTNTRECDVKGTKHDVAGQLLIALEALLPDTCQVCKEIYTVEREDTPSLRCKGCSQGFHQACYDRLEVGPSLAELPGEFSWLCTVCAPLYQLTTVVGGSRGQERPRVSSRCPSTLPTTAEPEPAQSDSDEEVIVGAQGAEAATSGPAPPPLPPTETAGTAAQDQTGPAARDCALYLSGECPFGISGRTGGTCPDKHPKRCMPYMRWGNKHGRGCSGTTCGKAHPTLCPKSQDLRCHDTLCPWKLHTHRCERSDQGRGQAGGNGRPYPQVRGFQRAPGQHQGQGGGRHQQAGGGNHQQAGGGNHQQAGGGRRSNQQVRTGSGNNPYFQGLTAQQNLLGAIEQQLQQAVARAIMQALSGAAPVWGTGVGNVPPSSYSTLTDS